MRLVSAITIIILILYHACCQETYNIEKHISQPLDHFDHNEKRTFKFTYFASPHNDHAQPNAPIYIWLDSLISEVDDKNFADGSLLIAQLAKETNGSMFLTTQRYQRYNDLLDFLPKDQDYFKFLTTEQLLADFANLIKNIKSQSGFKSSKVVLIGATDGARLAVWMRVKYPKLVDAVVASGAALLAKKEFKEYFDEIHRAYELYGTSECLTKLDHYYHSIEELFKTPKGIDILIKRFNLCDNNNKFEKDVDKQYFWYTVLYWESCVYVTINGKSRMKSFCKNITNEIFQKERWCWNCNVNKRKEVFFIYNDWYQRCSEFGQFWTTSSERQPFVHWQPLDFNLQICKIWFGIDEKRMNEGIAKTNEKFGGITPNVTNVVFTYGELDPYRLLGVQSNLSDTVVSLHVKGAGAFNILHIRDDDSKEVIETRKEVVSLIKKWIAS